MNIDLKTLEENLVLNYKKLLKSNELLDMFGKLSTTELADSLGENYVMDYEIKPVSDGLKLLGRAFTIQLPSNDSKITNDAIDCAKEGDILVINTNNSYTHAVWGDVKTIKAMNKNIGGVVVDGSIRDVAKIRELGFPLFCKRHVMLASGKDGGGEFNAAISCGGVIVHSGDILMGDENGVIVIPKNKIEEALSKANKKLKSDEEKIKEILIKN